MIEKAKRRVLRLSSITMIVLALESIILLPMTISRIQFAVGLTKPFPFTPAHLIFNILMRDAYVIVPTVVILEFISRQFLTRPKPERVKVLRIHLLTALAVIAFSAVILYLNLRLSDHDTRVQRFGFPLVGVVFVENEKLIGGFGDILQIQTKHGCVTILGYNVLCDMILITLSNLCLILFIEHLTRRTANATESVVPRE